MSLCVYHDDGGPHGNSRESMIGGRWMLSEIET
jgi:hypothetical protein